ncbi:aminotransferase class I/II-fold pyridoxal phosphate-dependent enzyme [Bacillus cereus group sp. TH152-1LC]|uniref:aminotransferase class I/II-fold pyridoxal phosphate-dependent enzyme n=1 Tax=Bacillus cereus group sp. TH152-1LC TaxID=3018060 RepID=UPI0022E2ABD9|nr:aminotransferase class I/II-fold pyridoxal phosphate-dependent enzyme [Bacillus cereus group sp. TH152-1LC]MDA1675253.1 aminotransferase class I/II-fold pyridoxal phosphate-dependent enzyme [Bacillus cereus group sp. TH152-1LC]
MKHLLNPTIRSIEISGIRKIADKIKSYQDVVSLTIGEPDFKTPKFIKDAGKAALDMNYTFYAPTAGLLETRKAAAEFMIRNYNLQYNPNTEIVITNGSTEGIFMALKTMLVEGDEVLIPTPAYPGYEPVIDMCGGKLVPIDTTKSDFKLTKEQLEKHITDKTKVLILTYPSNPTGAILTKDELKELVEVLEEKEIFVISDELYSELTFGEEHASIAQFDSMKDKVVVINGVSKSHAMTGWRIGFIFGPEYITTEMLKAHQYLNTGINTMAQAAVRDALRHGNEEVLKMKREYQQRRDVLCSGLQTLGFEIIKPEGTFYAFPSVAPFGMNAFEFSEQLLEKARVGVLPSDVFTYGGNQHLRISFANSLENIEEALNRMESFIKLIK